MKRQLAVQQLLFNASRKPGYVQSWLDRLQGDVMEFPYSTDLFWNGTWHSFLSEEQDDRDSAVIREFDLRRYRPTLVEVMDKNGVPSVAIILEVRFAYRQEHTRLLDWRGASILFNPTDATYRVYPEESLFDGDEGLNLKDKQALELLVESVVKPIANTL